MSDDIGMEALAGDHGQRAAACVAAGCDAALHCDGQDGEHGAGREGRSRAELRRRRRGWRGQWLTLTPEDGIDFAEAIEKSDALLALA